MKPHESPFKLNNLWDYASKRLDLHLLGFEFGFS